MTPTNDSPGPRRVQMTRNKPWRADHPGAVIVDRRHPLGNPWRIKRVAGQWAVLDPDTGDPLAACSDKRQAVELAVRLYGGWLPKVLTAADVAALSGRPLACWCALDMPCHLDKLLAAVNTGRPGRTS